MASEDNGSVKSVKVRVGPNLSKCIRKYDKQSTLTSPTTIESVSTLVHRSRSRGRVKTGDQQDSGSYNSSSGGKKIKKGNNDDNHNGRKLDTENLRDNHTKYDAHISTQANLSNISTPPKSKADGRKHKKIHSGAVTGWTLEPTSDTDERWKHPVVRFISGMVVVSCAHMTKLRMHDGMREWCDGVAGMVLW